MEKKPFFVEIGEEEHHYYVPIAPEKGAKYRRVQGIPIYVRLSDPTHPEVLNLAFVVFGHNGKGQYFTTIIDATSGVALFAPDFISIQDYEDKRLMDILIANKIMLLMEMENSFADMLKRFKEEERKTVRQYGPLPEDHGQLVN